MIASPPLAAGVDAGLLGEDVERDAVVVAIEAVPRHVFVPPERRMRAALDVALPLSLQRRCPRPSSVARLLQAARERLAGRVLLVGVGTGYVAGVASRVASELVAVEADPRLRADARVALTALGGCGVTISERIPDGAELFDAVVVCGAVIRASRALVSKVVEGGRVVAPVGARGHASLQVYTRTARGFTRDDLGSLDIEALPLLSID